MNYGELKGSTREEMCLINPSNSFATTYNSFPNVTKMTTLFLLDLQEMQIIVIRGYHMVVLMFSFVP
jgi:hypothetical protein